MMNLSATFRAGNAMPAITDGSEEQIGVFVEYSH